MSHRHGIRLQYKDIPVPVKNLNDNHQQIRGSFGKLWQMS